jgi:ectoine hydroxylase-related dioxygenase (phytanoyl-CoA dioxygenase family)
MIPEIDLTGFTPVKDIKHSDLLLTAAGNFLQHGVLVIKNAYNPKFIDALNTEYLTKYKEYCVEKSFKNARMVGHRRTEVIIDVEGLFNSERLYANSKLMPLLEYLLGKTLILNSLGSVASLPGSQNQHVHRDMDNIYAPSINKKADYSWLSQPPVYAITVAVPLIPITPLTGNTRFWPGTHHSAVSHHDPDLPPGEDFTCDLGSCVIFDYRIIHAGMANNSDKIRPLIYNVYSRDWFRDTANYSKKDSLNITMEEFKKVPEEYQHLFAWTLKNQLKPTKTPLKKPGRNDPCFCNSGLKYKRCHGKS